MALPPRNLTYRNVKLAPMSHQELDDNFRQLDSGMSLIDSDLTAINIHLGDVDNHLVEIDSDLSNLNITPERILDASPDGGATNDF